MLNGSGACSRAAELRRKGRRLNARNHLRTAHQILMSAGAEAFAERARRELMATGETVRVAV
jgi:hypothetical protein